MQSHKQINKISNIINKCILNISSPTQFSNLSNALLHLPQQQEPQVKQKASPHKVQEEITKIKQQPNNKLNQQPLSNNYNKSGIVSHMSLPQSHIKISKQEIKEMQEGQGKPFVFRSSTPKESSKRQKQPLSEPPLIEGKRNYTEQSSQRSKTNQKQSVSGSQKRNMKSSQSEYINLQLTQRSKKEKSSIQGRVDSLLYSDVTLLYSNDTGFGHNKTNNLQGKVASVKKVEESQEINAKMQRAQSRQCQRMRTQSQKASQTQRGKQEFQKEAKEEANIFKTQITEYKSKVSKIRQLKENKKRKLQVQLQKINQQLQQLTKKQHSNSASKNSKPNNFQSRVKISDNNQAKAKAVKLVRNLNNEKKSRQDAQLGELHIIDKNINNYMQELMKERYKNQERIKQRKKLEIIDRMKQQELRKIEQQKQKDKNIQFVQQLRGSNSRNHVQAQRKITQNHNQPATESVKSKQRNPTRKSESLQEITPELSRKKAYLKKIRNINFKKEKVDQYEQVLN